MSEYNLILITISDYFNLTIERRYCYFRTCESQSSQKKEIKMKKWLLMSVALLSGVAGTASFSQAQEPAQTRKDLVVELQKVRTEKHAIYKQIGNPSLTRSEVIALEQKENDLGEKEDDLIIQILDTYTIIQMGEELTK